MASEDHNTIRINETYTSIQGEGLHSGLLCFFIRMAGCDLRCHYCDSPGALTTKNSKKFLLIDLAKKIPLHLPLVQITGGEPLLQKTTLIKLCNIIHKNNPDQKILLETGGHLSIESIPNWVHIVMDIKLAGSGEDDKNFFGNLQWIKKTDEIKFVICDLIDYNQAKSWIAKYNLNDICNLLVSPAFGDLKPHILADQILQDGLPVRFQLQLHKTIWGNKTGI